MRGPSVLAAAISLLLGGCVAATILERNVVAWWGSPRRVPGRITAPARPDARIAALWVGHATVVVQLDDKFILTDPVFTETVGGGWSRRLVEPGLAARDLPAIDVVAISHMHIDHLSFATLDQIAPKVRQLVLPTHGLVYLPDYPFATDEVARWQTVTQGELRITAVPVRHSGYRYGADAAWMRASATGWLFEYHGLTVYFGGDTAYDQAAFAATAARFPHIDLAILPIGPVEPRASARRNHLDGREALAAFADLGATHMLPIHYDTFAHGADALGDAERLLRRAMREAAIGDDRVHVLPIGGQLALEQDRCGGGRLRARAAATAAACADPQPSAARAVHSDRTSDLPPR